MPVLEAMASGLPVVTTDCLGVRTFCQHGHNCLMAKADDAAGGLTYAVLGCKMFKIAKHVQLPAGRKCSASV
jgi:glycosyltransferase involved in cell wall biosynthesis